MASSCSGIAGAYVRRPASRPVVALPTDGQRGATLLETDGGGLRTPVAAAVVRVAQGLADVVGHRQVAEQDAVQLVGQDRSVVQHARYLPQPVLHEEVR